MNSINNETAAVYTTEQTAIESINAKLKAKEDAVIERALKICKSRLVEFGDYFLSPDVTVKYCQLLLANEEIEHFHILFLNNQNRLITDERMFSGSIDSASVYPREVVKACLKHNAAAVIFTHNHPSGSQDISDCDKRITAKLKEALQTIDVRVLDHIIVAGTATVSFANEHLM